VAYPGGVQTDTGRLADMLVVLADTLVDKYDVIDLLYELTLRCVELIDVKAAGVVLADPAGRLRVAAASTEQARLLELFELQAAEGPCLDAYRSGTLVYEADLTGASGRWPGFAPVAVAAGYASVQAVPMQLRGQVLGALNLFGDRPGALPPDRLRLAQALAHIATIGIVQQRRTRDGQRLAEQLQTALDSRVLIEQATGVVAGKTGLGVDQAFTLLRGSARRFSRRLSDVAHDIVHGGLDVDSLR
jgi:GAF domain-containing protein